MAALRLIPAHAGKTPVSQPDPSLSRAHPRSRGENSEAERPIRTSWGSSPLTRGKHRTMAMLYPAEGLIPAHAGKTPACGSTGLPTGAHPRSRGENSSASWRVRDCDGSSPLTRGKQDHSSFLVRVAGLIPAHAGKTRRRPARTSGYRAHPRSRGENSYTSAIACLPVGSSPLTRGKRQIGLTHQLLQRLIPAHAGKTVTLRPSR